MSIRTFSGCSDQTAKEFIKELKLPGESSYTEEDKLDSIGVLNNVTSRVRSEMRIQTSGDDHGIMLTVTEAV